MTARAILIWAALVAAIALPLALAATSPLLAYRDPIYIAAGVAGILALGLLLIQPLLAAGMLPALTLPKSRRVHGVVGLLLLLCVTLHVAGLWITSPPDVVDALLFRSPTPFSLWGVIAMWAVLTSAILATRRRKLRPRTWRLIHTSLAVIIIAGTVAHALLIQGTMEPVTKAGLCALVILAAIKPVLSTWRTRKRG